SWHYSWLQVFRLRRGRKISLIANTSGRCGNRNALLVMVRVLPILATSKRNEAQMKGPRMDTYADLISFVGWPDTGAIMRRLDDGKGAGGGKPGNMYKQLGATEQERQKNLNLFKQWVGKDAWKLN